ncbi:hypothetical protein OEZ85_011126 [Tetradesmus obliquus]|uniref:G-patch domain-containing protein n=1 Tax=Tetradesmus obliquus TaxID=3088 RepID=A0ABY8TPB8_TETOB|nr:hypothetical protein OEZ85_011126 [Tetradesmus obliquus]
MASASTLPNLYQGVEKESFGYKLLANFGWKEGQGLGANKQGIKEHLKVKKKQDALGVGAAEQAHKLRDWTTGMVGYDAILTGLKEISRGGPSSSIDEDDSSEQGHSSGYDSDSDTSGGAPAKPAAAAAAAKQESKKKSKKAAAAAAEQEKQKKRGKKQQGKAAADADSPTAKRAKKSHGSSSSSSESDSGLDSDSDSDTNAQPAAAAAGVPKTVSRVKAASHLGRYQKREKAKTVRNYSANDLAAILGLPGSAPPVANGEGAAGWAAAAAVSNPAGAGAGGSSSSSDSGSSSDSDSEAGGEQRLRPSTPPGSDSPPGRSQQRGLGDGKAPNLVVDEELQPVSDDREEAAGQRVWWRSLFVRAGRTGGAGPAAAAAAAGSSKQRINISGFQEDDQTNLYMQAQEGATKGKQGLGRSSMPKKVAGTRWQGKKTQLGSDSEDEAEEEQQQQEGDAAAGEAAAATAAAAAARTYVKNGITIVMPVKRGQQGQQQQQQGEAAAAAGGKEQKMDKKQKQSKQQQQQLQQDAAGSSKPKREKKQKQEEAAAAAVGSSKKRKQQQAVEAAAAAAGGSSQKKSKKAKQEQQQQPQPQQQQVPQVKWAKLAAKILEGAPKKRMRVQKLHREVVAAAGYDVEAPGVDTEQLFAQMLRKLKKAEGLAVCEKYVGLAG